jgi:CubicO group peptidase (beta-lactamase class C family)
MVSRKLVAWIAVSLTAAAFVPGEAPAQTCDFAPITQIVDGLLAANPQIPGAALRLAKGEQVLYERYFGTYTAQTVVPIASATKLLSAATVMTLVDAGRLDLDAPVSVTLSAFTDAKGGMTLRQMFSHTSGLPGGLDYPVLADKTITLAQAVDQIACCIPLAAAPGAQFAYGGLSMQVGGRVAEVSDGRLWDALFAQRLARPLGMTHTDYDGFGPTDNPRIAGGARSTLDDYGRLLEMLLAKGSFRGSRILSAAAVTELWKDQTFGVPIAYAPVGFEGLRYGLGAWRNLVTPQGEALRVSSPGAFGFTPWLDLDLGSYGIFMVTTNYQPLLDEMAQIESLAHAEIAACAPTPAVAATSPAGRVALALALATASAAAWRRGRSRHP